VLREALLGSSSPGRLHEQTRTSDTAIDPIFWIIYFAFRRIGGSVATLVFGGSKHSQTHPKLKSDTLSTRYLDNDFLSYSLARLLGPDIIKPVFAFCLVGVIVRLR
jgi:hypothetical protein